MWEASAFKAYSLDNNFFVLQLLNNFKYDDNYCHVKMLHFLEY